MPASLVHFELGIPFLLPTDGVAVGGGVTVIWVDDTHEHGTIMVDDEEVDETWGYGVFHVCEGDPRGGAVVREVELEDPDEGPTARTVGALVVRYLAIEEAGRRLQIDRDTHPDDLELGSHTIKPRLLLQRLDEAALPPWERCDLPEDSAAVTCVAGLDGGFFVRSDRGWVAGEGGDDWEPAPIGSVGALATQVAVQGARIVAWLEDDTVLVWDGSWAEDDDVDVELSQPDLDLPDGAEFVAIGPYSIVAGGVGEVHLCRLSKPPVGPPPSPPVDTLVPEDEDADEEIDLMPDLDYDDDADDGLTLDFEDTLFRPPLTALLELAP